MKTVEKSRAHYEKYANIVSKKSCLHIPATKDEVIKALESGDIHLNTIPLRKWDAYAPSVGATNWKDGKALSSLAGQVCTLKHYAIFHVAGYKPVFTD